MIFESIPSSPEEVEVFADGLSEAYLHCRVWGHDPYPHNVTIAKEIEGVPRAHWDVGLSCTHGCGVKWRALTSTDGEMIERKLDYAEAPGYLSKTGRIDKTGKQILRKHYLTRRAPIGAKKGKGRR